MALAVRTASAAASAAALAGAMPLPLLLLAMALIAPPSAVGAPTTMYGLQLPDPLHVYTLQETKPENLRNDPFLVVFKTHVPSLRPYEIPYFPSNDHLSAEEQDNVLPPRTVTQASTRPPPAEQQVAETGSKAKPEEKLDLDRLPVLVELEPGAVQEALDAAKVDAEESQTGRPPDPPGDATARPAPTAHRHQDEKASTSSTEEKNLGEEGRQESNENKETKLEKEGVEKEQ